MSYYHSTPDARYQHKYGRTQIFACVGDTCDLSKIHFFKIVINQPSCLIAAKLQVYGAFSKQIFTLLHIILNKITQDIFITL